MSIVQQAYNAVRPYLPREWETYNGVEVRSARVLDQTLAHPNYKQGVLDEIRDHVDGKTVELVGFGRGVTTTIALEAGAVHVDAYEAADEMVSLGVETLMHNGAPLDRVTLYHALVGEGIDIFGSPEGASEVSPSTLGGGDVLILDCEGAERSILSGMTHAPPVAIVETHPTHDAGREAVSGLLRDLGYDEVRVRDYEPGRPEKDVLVGVRDS